MAKKAWANKPFLFIQQGQSSLEAFVVLPFVAVLGLVGVQLLWLLFAQHILLSATSYVALYAATAPTDTIGQQLVFQQRIKVIQQDALILPQIRLVSPSAELSRQFAYYDPSTQLYEFDPAFAHLQLAEQKKLGTERVEKWLQLSVLEVEVTWCFRLRVVELVAGGANFVQGFFPTGWVNKESNRGEKNLLLAPCALYQASSGRRYFPLRAVVKTPLQSKRQWRLESGV